MTQRNTETSMAIGAKFHKENAVIMIENVLSKKIIGCVPKAFGKVHKQLGPGLFESAVVIRHSEAPINAFNLYKITNIQHRGGSILESLLLGGDLEVGKKIYLNTTIPKNHNALNYL